MLRIALLFGSVLSLAACGASGVPASGVPASGVPASGLPAAVGEIDMGTAVQQTLAGQAARVRVMRSFAARQRELDERHRALAEMRTRLDARGGPMAQAVGSTPTYAEVIAYAEELQALQRDHATYQQQLQREERALAGELVGRLRRIADRLAAERGVIVVFDVDGYAAPGVRRLDLTNELIERYDAEYPASTQ